MPDLWGYSEREVIPPQRNIFMKGLAFALGPDKVHCLDIANSTNLMISEMGARLVDTEMTPNPLRGKKARRIWRMATPWHMHYIKKLRKLIIEAMQS